MPLVLRHPDVVLQLVGEGRARALLDLRVEDAVDAAVVALLAVEVAVHRLGEQGVDHVVFLLLRDEDVDVELGAKARDALHELQRADLELPIWRLMPWPLFLPRLYSVSSTSTAWMSPSDSIAARASLAVVTPAKAMPSGLSSDLAAAFSPLTNSRRTRCSSLTTRMRLTGFAMRAASIIPHAQARGCRDRRGRRGAARRRHRNGTLTALP